MDDDTLRALVASEAPAVLVTILRVRGSAPRHPGSKMLVQEGRIVSGTVGGGRGEAAALEAAVAALESRKSSVLRVEMLGAEAEGGAMICGGEVELLVEYLDSPGPYRSALAALDGGRRAILEKTLGPQGSDGSVLLTVRVLEEGRSEVPARASLAEEGGRWVFVDPLLPAERLLILGGGYVGRALATLAVTLDFQVTVADDREAFVSPGRFPPEVRRLHAPYAQAIASFSFSPAVYVVVVTRGHLHDLECARSLLGVEYRYLGIIGSARKIGLLLDQLAADGWPEERLSGLRAPIGLDIGAETPEEIAVSIAAELVAARRNAALPSSLTFPRRGISPSP